MAETSVSFARQPRVRLAAAVLVLAAAGVVAWIVLTAGRESTDDAQVDAHVTQIAARVGGTVTRVAVDDNQLVDAGTVLVELDPRDYQVAVDKARAELADAEAIGRRRAERCADHDDHGREQRDHGARRRRAGAGRRGGCGKGSRGGARAADDGAGAPARSRSERDEGGARRRTAPRAARERRGLAAAVRRDVATADAQKAATDSARSQVAEAEAGIRVAESRLAQAHAGEQQAGAELADGANGALADHRHESARVRGGARPAGAREPRRRPS